MRGKTISLLYLGPHEPVFIVIQVLPSHVTQKLDNTAGAYERIHDTITTADGVPECRTLESDIQ
jgi:hypothetical protein